MDCKWVIVELLNSFINYGPNKRRSCNWVVTHLRIKTFYDFYVQTNSPKIVGIVLIPFRTVQNGIVPNGRNSCVRNVGPNGYFPFRRICWFERLRSNGSAKPCNHSRTVQSLSRKSYKYPRGTTYFPATITQQVSS